jgi:steroid delta-isomerase-like uncharacterized protein
VEAIAKYLDAWNRHDPEGAAAMVCPEVLYEDVAAGRVMRSPKEVADWVRENVAWSSDFHFELTGQVASGDDVHCEWVLSGTHTGDLRGIPATGRPFSVRGASIARIEGGRIREQRDYWDRMTLLIQLGVLPDPGALSLPKAV